MNIIGTKSVILDGQLYKIDHDGYDLIHKKYNEYLEAKRRAKDDFGDCADEWNDFNNMCTWVKENFKPLTDRKDNFDIPDGIFAVTENEELPF